MVRSALILAACGLSSLCAAACDKTPTAEVPKAGVVAIRADDKGFTPGSVEVKKGEKVQLVVTRTSDDTCAKDVIFPEIGFKKELPLNTPVTIDVPTDTSRTLTFQCGMGMFKSKVVIK